jgi:single-strand DNA-binding protein
MGFNKTILLGNLGADPKSSVAKNGTTVCNASLATSRRYTDKQGNKKEEVEWHNLRAFGGIAETMRDYLKCGSKIMIEGRLQTNSWTDKNDKKQYMTSIVIQDLQMLDSKGSGGGFRGEVGKVDNSQPSGNQQPEYFDDDIPF